MVCLCQSEWRSTRISRLAGWWQDPAIAECTRMSTSTWPNTADLGREHAYVITDALPSVVVWRRVISSDCKKSSTCAASKQFNVPCPHHVLDAGKLSRWSSESLFTVFFLHCKRVDPEWFLQEIFYDGMFSVGIAAAKMNCFKGSLYNFPSATHGFFRHYTFQAVQSTLVRRTVVHKTFDSSSSQMLRLWFLGCSPWNYWDSWKAAHQLLLASV